MRTDRFQRWTGTLAVATIGLLAVGVSGCNDWLEVTNPGAIENPALENTGYIDLMVNGVIGDFQPAFAWTAFFSTVFAGELQNHHAYFENGDMGRRAVEDINSTYTLAVYNGLHRARFLADSSASRIKVLLADSAGRDLRLARVLAYGGYSYTFLGEQMCSTPLNQSAAVSDVELLKLALARFQEAITVAGAARAAAAAIQPATSASQARVAGADSIRNFARVGAARVALGLGQFAEAASFASAVEPAYESAAVPGFRFDAHYLDGVPLRRTGNPFWEFLGGGDSPWFSVSGTPFEGLHDPRVPHTLEPVQVNDGSRRLLARSPSSFSTYDGSVEGGLFQATSSIRLASALEARYIIAEAEGLNAANLAFINSRRAVGGQAPLAAGISAAEYVDALRDQRSRDFFIDGHRLGDIRRYKRLYQVDLFPHGSYYGSATIQFGTQECWPVPLVDK
jgi:hypothetical protein